ncbi:hypothetical protein OCOL_000466 [Ordospora colligata]
MINDSGGGLTEAATVGSYKTSEEVFINEFKNGDDEENTKFYLSKLTELLSKDTADSFDKDFDSNRRDLFANLLQKAGDDRIKICKG